jgi:hypothetical protein
MIATRERNEDGAIHSPRSAGAWVSAFKSSGSSFELGPNSRKGKLGNNRRRGTRVSFLLTHVTVTLTAGASDQFQQISSTFSFTESYESRIDTVMI